MADKSFCTACGAACGRGDAYCRSCGAGLSDPGGFAYSRTQRSHCTGCGAKLESHGSYCRSCGLDCSAYIPVVRGVGISSRDVKNKIADASPALKKKAADTAEAGRRLAKQLPPFSELMKRQIIVPAAVVAAAAVFGLIFHAIFK